MNTVFILDKDTKTELSEELKIRILEIVNEKGHTIEVVELGKYDVFPDLHNRLRGVSCPSTRYRNNYSQDKEYQAY